MPYDCECVSCGYEMESDSHCKDLKCPECGGQMRRAERPGPGTTGRAVISMALNGAQMQDNGDTVTFPAVIAAEGVYDSDGSDEAGYRSAEETRKMIRYCNGLRIVEKHPKDNISQFIGADLMDPEFPVFGVTQNAHESPNPGPNGEVRIATDLLIDKVDRAGNNRAGLIEGMAKGEVDELSITYFFIRAEGTGTFAGKHYDFLETEVNPYGLGMMTDGWRAKCSPPTCAVGQAGQEGAEMADDNASPPEEGGKDTTLNMNAEIKAALADMCPDKVAEVNEAVNARFKTLDKAEKRVGELEEEAKKWDEERKELESYRAEKTKAEQAELDKAIEFVKGKLGPEAYKVRFPDEVSPTMEQLEAEAKYVDMVVPPEAEPAPEPEAAQNAEPKPFYLAASGKRKDEAPAEPDRDDCTDGKIPL